MECKSPAGVQGDKMKRNIRKVDVDDYQFWSAVHRRLVHTNDEKDENILKKASVEYSGQSWIVV